MCLFHQGHEMNFKLLRRITNEEDLHNIQNKTSIYVTFFMVKEKLSKFSNSWVSFMSFLLKDFIVKKQ